MREPFFPKEITKPVFCGDKTCSVLVERVSTATKYETNYSITCIQRPPKGNNESGLLQQVVFKYRLLWVYLTRDVVSEQWSLKVVHCLIQVVSNTGLKVMRPTTVS